MIDVERFQSLGIMLTLASLAIPAIVAALRACNVRPQVLAAILWATCAVFAALVIVADLAVLGEPPADTSGWITYLAGILIALALLSQLFYRTVYKLAFPGVTNELESGGAQLGNRQTKG